MKGKATEKTRLNAEWIWYMEAYRLYDPEHPEWTVAYVDDLDQARVHHPEYEIVEEVETE